MYYFEESHQIDPTGYMRCKETETQYFMRKSIEKNAMKRKMLCKGVTAFVTSLLVKGGKKMRFNSNPVLPTTV